MNTNDHIEEYLNFYYKKDNAVSFAVLLKGKWGCGKTYFIKKHINSTDSKIKKIHISLYGLSSFIEIKEKIIVKLLPLMPAGYGKIVMEALKSIPGIKKFISSDSDGLIIDLFLKGKNGKVVLIFDDLERCDIEIGRLLGYINHLVEFQGQKVIIIANEEAILETNPSRKYREIKEKLIGKEFSVNSNPDEAINIFIQNITNNALKKNSDTIKRLLLKILEESKFENLRLIEQSLSSFDYFYKLIEDSVKESPEAFERIFYEFIVISIEYKKGNIKSEDFFKGYSHFYKKPEDKEMHFLDKYNDMGWITCINIKNLGKILQGISLNQKEKNALVKNIQDITNTNQESWQKVWNFEKIEDDEFFENLKDVQQKWDNNKYSDFFTVVHIIGIFLNFSKFGLLEKSPSEIIKEGKVYIDFLIKTNKFPIDIKERDTYFKWKSGAYGLGYNGSDFPEWKKILEYIDKKADELRPLFIQEKIKSELIPALKGGKKANQELGLLINHNFLYNSFRQREAYFGCLDANEIKNIIISRDSIFLILLGKIFKERYIKRKEEINNIETEYIFLENLKKSLLAEIDIIENKYGKRTLRSFFLKDFIDKSLIPFIPKKEVKKLK
jgi:hypothetical protein